MPKVLNKHKDDCSDGVFCGRPSKFGNPFILGKDGNRKEVMKKYLKYISENYELIAIIRKELKGQNLICFCAPLQCHCDVLLEIANYEEYIEPQN